jgi:hypothetical protein
MNRCLAFLFALVLATLTVSSACVASPSDWTHFTLEPDRDSGRIHATFGTERRDHGDNHWSTGLVPSELIGLDVAAFRGAGTRPLRFAVVREAGRLDCSGNGGDNRAAGNCNFTADPGFTQLLVSRGIGRPTREESFGLMAINARREVVDAVVAAHYPAPTIDNLMALTALGVNGRYITDLARVGYRPPSIDTLIQFKALGISPDWIGGFARIGYANVPADELVQLKALNITPAFIAGYDQAGYRHLPVDTLVQLKALNITPEFARSAANGPGPMPSVDQLVQMKLFGQHRR